MKKSIWKRWNLDKEINIGSTGSLPSFLFYFIFGSWLFTILLIISMIIVSDMSNSVV